MRPSGSRRSGSSKRLQDGAGSGHAPGEGSVAPESKNGGIRLTRHRSRSCRSIRKRLALLKVDVAPPSMRRMVTSLVVFETLDPRGAAPWCLLPDRWLVFGELAGRAGSHSTRVAWRLACVVDERHRIPGSHRVGAAATASHSLEKAAAFHAALAAALGAFGLAAAATLHAPFPRDQETCARSRWRSWRGRPSRRRPSICRGARRRRRARRQAEGRLTTEAEDSAANQSQRRHAPRDSNRQRVDSRAESRSLGPPQEDLPCPAFAFLVSRSPSTASAPGTARAARIRSGVGGEALHERILPTRTFQKLEGKEGGVDRRRRRHPGARVREHRRVDPGPQHVRARARAVAR